MARKLVVEIVGDASSLDRSFKQANRSAQQFDKNMSAVTRGSLAASGAFAGLGRQVAFASAGFLGGVGLVAGTKSVVQATSDLNESVNAVNVVFGTAAKTILDFSEDAVTKAGLSMAEFNQLATPVGAMLQNTGDSALEAANKTIVLTQRAADMASVFNTSVPQALQAIQSALRGEADPIEVYGVKLNEATVNAEAMRLGLAKTVGQINEAAKAQARYSLILQQTAQFQGDFANTADGAANQAKIFHANVENLKAELGEGLIPALTGATRALNDFFGAIKPGGRLEFLNKGALENLSNLGKRIAPKSTAAGRFFRRHDTPEPGVDVRGAEAIRAAGQAIAQAFDVLPSPQQAAEEAKQAKERAARVREARAAVRQETEERARIAVDRAGLTESVADDIAALQRLNALLARRIRGGHDVLANEREQIAVQLQINALLEQQRQAREEAARKAREARDARQFRLLGFGSSGEELVPGVNNLKRQLASVGDAIAGSFLDTRKTRGLLGHIRQVLSGGLGSVSADVRRRIQEILADLRNQLKRSSVDVTRFQHSATGQLTLAGAHPRVGQGITVNGGIHLHGVQSVAEMEEALAKRRKQRARQRRSTR